MMRIKKRFLISWPGMRFDRRPIGPSQNATRCRRVENPIRPAELVDVAVEAVESLPRPLPGPARLELTTKNVD
jgi:hypothetical protein